MKKRIVVNPRGRHRKNEVGQVARNKARLINMRKDVAALAIRSDVLFCDLGRDDISANALGLMKLGMEH